MPTLIYSTDNLPADYCDEVRQAHWQDFSATLYGSLDCRPSRRRPFSMSMDFSQIGAIGVGGLSGTMSEIYRPCAPDAGENFTMLVNRGARMLLRDGLRETTVLPGAIVMGEGVQRNGMTTDGDFACISLHFSVRSLVELVPDAHDRLCQDSNPDAPAVRHLNRYLDFMRGSGEIEASPQLAASAATTLLDLVALAIGADRDTAALAAGRGLRAARLQDILRIVQKSFCDPAFGANEVAAKLDVTPRYIQQLLHEAGPTFSERVLELRLQKARTMLGDARCDHLRVGDIALACGFGDASYFNRCFRQRFGTTPTQYRGSQTMH